MLISAAFLTGILNIINILQLRFGIITITNTFGMKGQERGMPHSTGEGAGNLRI